MSVNLLLYQTHEDEERSTYGTQLEQTLSCMQTRKRLVFAYLVECFRVGFKFRPPVMGQFELKKEDKVKLVVLGEEGLIPLALFDSV